MFCRPVEYPITRFFGEKDQRFEWSMDPDTGFWRPFKDGFGMGQHRGTDFECPDGTLVRAMAGGIVTRARQESGDLVISQVVNLLGHDSWTLRYTHLSAIFVKPGQEVLRYQPIAESGKSLSGAAFLHVELVDLRRQWKVIPLN